MTFSSARVGKVVAALLVLAALVFLASCGPFREHPPRASDAWEPFSYTTLQRFVVASRHYGPSWGRIDGEDVIVFGYRAGCPQHMAAASTSFAPTARS